MSVWIFVALDAVARHGGGRRSAPLDNPSLGKETSYIILPLRKEMPYIIIPDGNVIYIPPLRKCHIQQQIVYSSPKEGDAIYSFPREMSYIILP